MTIADARMMMPSATTSPMKPPSEPPILGTSFRAFKVGMTVSLTTLMNSVALLAVVVVHEEGV